MMTGLEPSRLFQELEWGKPLLSQESFMEQGWIPRQNQNSVQKEGGKHSGYTVSSVHVDCNMAEPSILSVETIFYGSPSPQTRIYRMYHQEYQSMKLKYYFVFFFSFDQVVAFSFYLSDPFFCIPEHWFILLFKTWCIILYLQLCIHWSLIVL